MTGGGDGISDTVSGTVGSGSTVAAGIFEQNETYKMVLKLGSLPEGSAAKLQKLSGSNWVDVREGEDILQLQSDLRILIRDNTTWNLSNNRANLYRNRRSQLRGILNPSIPLRVEVSKYVGDPQRPLTTDEGIRASIGLIDVEENIDLISGVRNKSGKEFVREFNRTLRGDAPQDNCAQNLAPSTFEERCRDPARGGKAPANRVITYANGRNLPLLRQDGALQNIVLLDSWEQGGEGNTRFLSSSIRFNPPTVLGDNYRLRLALEGDLPPIYKQGNRETFETPQTPKITLWRSVKVQMIIQGKDANDDGLYRDIDWQEIRKAYRDAYIEIDYPRIKAADRTGRDDAVYYIVTTPEWIKYLDRHVYRNWKHRDWLRLKNDRPADLNTFLEDYSFPQSVPASGSGSPVSLVPSDTQRPTTWTLLERLAKEISRKVLSDANASSFESTALNDCSSPASLYIIMCRTPGPSSGVGGAFMGDKRFYMVSTRDAAGTLTHEMGHALFLEHGATKFHNALDSNSSVRFSVATESNESGSSGPKWDLHDSEDTFSCVMSYYNRYSDPPGYWNCRNWWCDSCWTNNQESSTSCSSCRLPRGRSRACGHQNARSDTTCAMCGGPKGSAPVEFHAVDWHFCGSCLLLLRFYDMQKLVRHETNRRLQFSLRKGGDMPIAHAITSVSTSGGVTDLTLMEASMSSDVTLNRGGDAYLMVLYPEERVATGSGTEGITNNLGYVYRLDVSRHPRGRWEFTDTEGNEVQEARRVIRLGRKRFGDGTILTRAVATNEGTNRVRFGIVREEGNTVWSRSFTIRVGRNARRSS